MEITLTDRALLFDLDVTLVRTGDIVVESMTAWCRLHRLDLQLVLSHSSGMRIEDTVAKVAPHLDADAECKRIEEIESGCLEKLEPVFGAVELVRKLDPNLWGIVTSSSLALAHRKIDAAGISAPKTLISSESVTNGKPHPECYGPYRFHGSSRQPLPSSPARTVDETHSKHFAQEEWLHLFLSKKDCGYR